MTSPRSDSLSRPTKNLPPRPWLLFLGRLNHSTRTSELLGARRDPSCSEALRRRRSQYHPSVHPNTAPINDHRVLLIVASSRCCLGPHLRAQTPRRIATFDHLLQELPIPK